MNTIYTYIYIYIYIYIYYITWKQKTEKQKTYFLFLSGLIMDFHGLNKTKTS